MHMNRIIIDIALLVCVHPFNSPIISRRVVGGRWRGGRGPDLCDLFGLSLHCHLMIVLLPLAPDPFRDRMCCEEHCDDQGRGNK